MSRQEWKAVVAYIAKSDTLTTVLPAIIVGIGAICTVLAADGSVQNALKAGFGAFATIYLDSLRRKANTSAQATADVKTDLDTTKEMLNGRLADLLAAKDAEHAVDLARAMQEGYAKGLATATAAVSQSPNLSVGEKELAAIVSNMTHIG